MWWKSVSSPFCMMADVVAWDTFRAQSQKKFIPDHVSKHMKIEFHQLMKGLMAVKEYTHEFMRLSHIALESIGTEEKKVGWLMDGLRHRFRKNYYGKNDTVARVHWSNEQNQNVLLNQPK